MKNVVSDSKARGLTLKEHQTKIMRANLTFEQWFDVLKKLSVNYGWDKEDEYLHPDDWEDYFKLGYAPECALMENASYGRGI